jgi:3-dehydroquinate dehydratase II
LFYFQAMKIAIINGPNLNLLGSRERGIYGDSTFEAYFGKLKKQFSDVQLEYFQSNIEGELVSIIQKCGSDCNGVVLNAAGYTHTSVAIADAVAAISIPVIEVHISNIFSREDYRHVSYLGAKAAGIIAGFGLSSYELAIEYLKKK